jgi:hypothetical protein
MQVDLENIHRSDIMNYIAEVFYEEYLFLIDEDMDQSTVWIKQSGVGSRVFSKDILDVSHHAYMTGSKMADSTMMHLSRNSIYHQLPEFVFHPVSVRTRSMGTRDVVDAMRANKVREEENIQFFIPFDTELFKKTLKLNNRHLHVFTDKDALGNIFSIGKKLTGKSFGLTKQEYYKLFRGLCNSEELKENLPELEILFVQLMGEKVLLKYKDRVNDTYPFLPIGSAILGASFGMQGDFILEQEDILATVVIEETKTFEFFMKTKKIIQEVLEFFVFSNRSIIVEFRFEAKEEFLLGENFLGFDTKLQAIEI